MTIIIIDVFYKSIMLFLNIRFLVEWIKSNKEINKYLNYGALFAIIIEGSNLLIESLTPSFNGFSVFMVQIMAIDFIYWIGLTSLGMYFSAVLGYPSFTILLRKFKPMLMEENFILNRNINLMKKREIETPYNSAQNNMRSYFATDVLIEIDWKDYLFKTIGLTIVAILYSLVLFYLTNPYVSEIVRKKFAIFSTATDNVTLIVSILFLLKAAITEEIIFRLGIQNFLVNYWRLQDNNYWIAIVVTSALWSCAHIGILEPEWVKFAQIFPQGLIFGWLFKKYGIESTMIAHGLFNLMIVFLASWLNIIHNP